MTNAVLAIIALGLVIGRAVAERRDPFCKHNEYPSRIDVGEYGEIRFQCSPVECGYIQPKCNQIFFELSCKNKQWVGGVAASSNLNNLVPLQCCDVPAMARSRSRGSKVIGAGQHFAGEQLRDNRGNLVSFDVIKNVQKVQHDRNRYALEVHVARLSCKGKGPGLESAQLRGGSDFGSNFGGDFRGSFDQFGPADGVEIGLELPAQPVQPLQPIQPLQPAFGPQPFAPPPVPFEPLPPLPPVPPEPLGAIAAVPAAIGGGGAGACFTGDTLVDTPSGPKTMEELKIGDQVLTLEENAIVFTPVTSFIHRLPEKTTIFQNIEAEDGSSVTLTPQHFIYTLPCHVARVSMEMKFASDVKVGDCLLRVDGETGTQKRVPVVSNTEVTETGAYAPMTANGAVVTNKILSSCHSVFRNDDFMDNFVRYASMVKDAFGGVVSLVRGQLPESVVELPWLVQYGATHLENLVISK